MPRIAICAPATPITRDVSEQVERIAGEFADLDLHFHPQCFEELDHFAGSHEVRTSAFLDCANDASFDAVWFAKGGYGSNVVALDALARLSGAARGKAYMGYSDAGYLLAALYRAGFGRVAHGPMPVDIRREGGDAAVRRALNWFCGDKSGAEPTLEDGRPAVAFNLITLAMLCGTDLMPDLSCHVVMVEEVAEHLYAIDRLFFHVVQHIEGVAGLRLGRLSKVPENDRAFGSSPEEIAKFWCARAGIPFLGTADIGHDAANTIVPFGLAGSAARP